MKYALSVDHCTLQAPLWWYCLLCAEVFEVQGGGQSLIVCLTSNQFTHIMPLFSTTYLPFALWHHMYAFRPAARL